MSDTQPMGWSNPPPPPPERSGTDEPWYKRWWLGLVVVGLLLGLFIGAAGQPDPEVRTVTSVSVQKETVASFADDCIDYNDSVDRAACEEWQTSATTVASTTTTKPKPTSPPTTKAAAPPPPPEPDLDPHFGTCKEAIANGYGPYYEGQDPEYDWYTDRDHDGVVCE